MPKKIVFMGTPMFAVPILKSLYQNGYPISNVYTQPPQKSQRGQRINKSPIQGIAETLNLDFKTPKSLIFGNISFNSQLNATIPALPSLFGTFTPKTFAIFT